MIFVVDVVVVITKKREGKFKWTRAVVGEKNLINDFPFFVTT